MAAGHDGIPGRRTDRVGGITAGEAASCRGNPIAVGCLVEGIRIVGADIHITQIVYEEENHIGSLRESNGSKESAGEEKKA